MFAYYIATGEYDSSVQKGKKGKRKVKIDEREKSRRTNSIGMLESLL